jgi:hypothetical protein
MPHAQNLFDLAAKSVSQLSSTQGVVQVLGLDINVKYLSEIHLIL